MFEYNEQVTGWLYDTFRSWGMAHDGAMLLKLFTLVLIVVLGAWIVDFIANRIMLGIVKNITKKTKTDVDDVLVEKRVFDRLAHLAPALVLEFTAQMVFVDYPRLLSAISKITGSYLVLVVILIISSLLDAGKVFLNRSDLFRDKPVGSYVQLGKIIAYSLGAIIIISIVMEKSPLYFFSALGAMTAVVLLVFKDTILGFVASIQLASNDMVRIGDWVSMDKYGADGDVVEINLATVKVKNWDKTITTIPTYAFISDSFKNWRGMTETGGRRIKRSINIKMSTIKFCTPEMLEQFKKSLLLKDFIEQRQQEIDKFNRDHNLDPNLTVLNGRKMTNVGIFRRYCEFYLQKNPKISKELSCMVRQLQPTETGLPIEVYAFSNDIAWANYEAIQADIFDHLLAAIKEFELEVFENPAGSDFREAFSK